MGMVPPPLLPFLRRRQVETKDEHPLQQEWDGIEEQQKEQRHPLLDRPSNPALDVRCRVPAPRVDWLLIGEDQR